MGGLWVDYGLQTTIPGLFAIGEANFSDHGANRLGASAMMQCLADGYFIVPHCVTDYLAGLDDHVDAGDSAFGAARDGAEKRLAALLGVGGTTPGDRLPPPARQRDARPLRDHARRRGPARGDRRDRAGSATSSGRDLRVDGARRASSTRASSTPGGVADFLEFAELMCRDALERDESCGCHLREEHQTEDGEAVRDDERFANVAVWEHRGEGAEPVRHTEPLKFEVVEPVTRSYK